MSQIYSSTFEAQVDRPQTVTSQFASVGTLLTSCEEESTVAGEIPSVTFKCIPQIIVHKSRSPSVEEFIKDTYKGEYSELTINPLVDTALHLGDDEGVSSRGA